MVFRRKDFGKITPWKNLIKQEGTWVVSAFQDVTDLWFQFSGKKDKVNFPLFSYHYNKNSLFNDEEYDHKFFYKKSEAWADYTKYLH